MHAAIVTAIPAVTFVYSDASISGTANDSTRGWQFSVTAPEGILVTRLGVYDFLGDGLAYAHPVGIWNSNGILLVSGIVPAGTTPLLDENGLFRLVDVPPVQLPLDAGYVIGALYSPFLGEDFQQFSVPGFMAASQIACQFPRYLTQSSPVLLFPTQILGGGPSIFGPSFEFQPIGEPATLTVLGVGLVGLGFSRRRKLKRSNTSLATE